MRTENTKQKVLNLIKLKYNIKKVYEVRIKTDFDVLTILTTDLKEISFIFDDYENKVYQIKDRFKKYAISLNRTEFKNLKFIGVIENE